MQTQKVAGGSETLWVIDPTRSSVEFSVKNFFIFGVKGSLSGLAGAIEFDNIDIRRSSIKAGIKAARIDTGNKGRDRHLRGAAFLDAEHYPDIRFQSTSVEHGTDRDTLRITGVLTIKAISKEVVLNVNEVDRSRSPTGEEVAYYSATTELDRFEFGMNYGRGFMGRKLMVAINVQASERK